MYNKGLLYAYGLLTNNQWVFAILLDWCDLLYILAGYGMRMGQCGFTLSFVIEKWN